jgi:plasmid stability protein
MELESVLEPNVPNLSIKDVPEALAEELRQRAARNHRSLQGELMAIVEHAVKHPEIGAETSPSSSGRVVGYDKRGWPVVRQGFKTPEQVFAEMRAQGVEPLRGQPLAVDIIRRDRDTR